MEVKKDGKRDIAPVFYTKKMTVGMYVQVFDLVLFQKPVVVTHSNTNGFCHELNLIKFQNFQHVNVFCGWFFLQRIES